MCGLAQHTLHEHSERGAETVQSIKAYLGFCSQPLLPFCFQFKLQGGCNSLCRLPELGLQIHTVILSLLCSLHAWQMNVKYTNHISRQLDMQQSSTTLSAGSHAASE